MQRRERPDLNTQIYGEASEWFLDFRAGDIDASARRQFDGWLRTSPEHVRAYLEIAAIWNAGPALDPEQKIAIDALIARAGEDNIVPLGAARPKPKEAEADSGARAGSYRRRWHRAFAASAAFLCVAAGIVAWLHVYRAPTYTTDIGEQRSIALTDGSSIELNSLSKVQVRFTDAERAVDLLKGQALFRVAKDAARPFIVRSDTMRVQAVGTQFDMYRKRNGTVVTVLEGRVAVLPERSMPLFAPDPSSESPAADVRPSVDAQPTPVMLSAGEQVTVTPQAAHRPTQADVAAAIAWTQRRLVFQAATLAKVAEEFNRYNARQLIIHDPAPDFHVSGMFSSTDPSSLVRFLDERPGINVTETNTEIHVTREK